MECDNLADWIAAGTGIDLRTTAKNTQWLCRCHDIANGAKHLTLRRKGATWHISLSRPVLLLETGGALLLGTGDRLALDGNFVEVGNKDGTWDFSEAADACLVEWDRILRETGLIPVSLPES